MEEHQVFPDVVPVAPAEVAKITYANGIAVNQGNVLNSVQVKDIPNVQWKANASNYYTLCMINPDFPSRKKPENGVLLHWLVGNIPGSRFVDGETLYEYRGNLPFEGTGLHRFVFLIYKQNGKLHFGDNRLTNREEDDRRSFNISRFVEKYKLGNPVAGNFYQLKWEYITIVYPRFQS